MLIITKYLIQFKLYIYIYYIMSVTIKQDILKYKKINTTTLEKMEELHSGYLCKNPEWFRKYYDRTSEALEKKTIEINKEKDYINECINNLEDCRNSFSEMEKVIKKIFKTLNRGKVGTLFGLCKQTIKENDISMDEIEKTVFSFPYEEEKEIEKFTNSIKNISVNEVVNNLAGKNNTKRKNYREKKGYNKSKKRRLKYKKV